MATTEAEQMTFLDKKRFFEKEIKDHATGKKPTPERKFSYLQEHEVANLKTEEEIKVASMSEDELSRYLEEKLVTEGTDYNKIITSSKVWTMKYEDDAIENISEDDGCDCLKDVGHQDDVIPFDQRIIEVKKQVAQAKINLDSHTDDANKACDIRKKSEEPEKIQHFTDRRQDPQTKGNNG